MGAVDFLKEIIEIPSLSGEEEQVARAVKKEMEKLGYEDIICAGGNVCGIRGNGPVKILYDAHMDVVNPGEEWERDPFKAVEKDGFLSGRGACDDKASLAAMIYAGSVADVSGLTLYILASVREEVSEGNGLQNFFHHSGIQPDFVVIGEPSNLMVSRGNRGRLGVKIQVKGRASHASRPREGENAIYRALEIVSGIKEINERRPGDTVSVTKVHTPGENINTIPERCIIYCDYRSAPGRQEKDILAEFEKIIETRDKVETITKYFKPWKMNRDHPLLRAALKCRSEVLGEAPAIEWVFCTNGSYTSGELEIPTVGFGPGEESQCHRTGEKIKTGQVEDAVEYLAQLPSFIKRESEKGEI